MNGPTADRKPGFDEPDIIDPVECIQSLAGEAVIAANTDPDKLSPEEHAHVDRLQRVAGIMASDANIKLVERAL